MLWAQVNYNFFKTAPSTSANCSIYPPDRKGAHLSFTLHFFPKPKDRNSALIHNKYPPSWDNDWETHGSLLFFLFIKRESCHSTKLNFPFIFHGWVYLSAGAGVHLSCCVLIMLRKAPLRFCQPSIEISLRQTFNMQKFIKCALSCPVSWPPRHLF